MLAFDDLSLIKTPVAWQCKRFAGNNVSSATIRDFRGSIEGRAKFGLVFTTTAFTPSAEAEARRPGATPIELIGLERLVELMCKHAIGVRMAGAENDGHMVDESFFAEYLHPTGGSAKQFKLT